MTTIKFRRDTSANWTSVNPIPAQGEPCYETDTGKLKIGNGSDNYTSLPYVSDGGGSGGTTDYVQLENKPQINSVELSGNKTLDDLGIQAKGDYQPAGDYATTADIPTKTSELTNDSGFLTEAPVPDNMVTTDTTQTISSPKTFSGSINTSSIYPSGEITFNSTSTSRYINYVDTIAGGYQGVNGYITFKGNTTIQGDDKLILNGGAGGVTITSSSGSSINCTAPLVLQSHKIQSWAGAEFSGVGITYMRGAKSQFNIGSTTKNIAIGAGTSRELTITGSDIPTGGAYITYEVNGQSDKIEFLTSGDLKMTTNAGVINTFINTANIDTTYMKMSDGKLSVDTAAVAHLAMPSSTSVSLTLGASGATYTAPADGYISLSATSGYTGWIKVDTRPGCYGYANSSQFLCNSPIIKDTSFKVWYSFSSGDASALQYTFIYCNGTTP